MRVIKCKYISIAFLGVILLGVTIDCVYAAPPFLTDDPIPTDLHHSELYLFAAGENAKEGTELNAPGIEWDYGIAPRLQFAITLALTGVRPNDEDDPVANGISDMFVGLKYMFVKENDYRPAIAIYPTVVFPTGDDDKGLGNGRGWYYFPIWLEKKWGSWTSYGGAGYAVNSASEMKNFWFGGVLIQYEFNDKWTLGAEIFSEGAQSTTEKSFTVINAGGYYNIIKDVDILFSIGNHLFGDRIFIGYIGIGFEW